MWMFVAWVGLTVVSYVFLRTTSSTVQVTPGDLEATTVDSSSHVPVLFGTRLISKTNCVWYGDVATTPIKSCSGGIK